MDAAVREDSVRPTPETAREALAGYLARETGARALTISSVRQLSGGAIQENWILEVAAEGGCLAGHPKVVLRTDAPSGVSVSHGRAEEFALLKVARAAGVTVPEPLFLSRDGGPLGRPFCIVGYAAGTATGPKVVKDTRLGGDRERLAGRLGEELARIHSIRPPHPELRFLQVPEESPAVHEVARQRGHLDALPRAHPAIEWGLRWCERHAPEDGEIALTHQDFRTGNYLVDAEGLTAVLDWEFAAWSDPLSDLGWFCARCWRFSRPDLEAGGIADREPFYRAYERASGRQIDPERVYFWEVMAHVRWAIIALQQGERFLSGDEASLELALIGRIVPPEIEAILLAMTAPEHWSGIR